ncbi:MAG: hypothetical protein LBE13_21315 [Bacteroidales bacterium]|nr:hypothetical protein [Bacteroidales bacterium]
MTKKHLVIGIVFIFISLICLFALPYLVPSNQVAISASYDYGFNNSAGMLLLALFSVIIIVVLLFYNKKNRLNVYIFVDNFQEVVLNKIFLITASLTVMGCGILWVILGRDSYGIIESGYFIPHIYDISWGKAIYRDFNFAYGPLLLYIPYFIYKLFSFLGISISDGYIIALMVNQLLGLYFLFYVLTFFNFSGKEKDRIFILIAVLSFPFSTGLNYTLFRFISPFFCFILLRQIERDVRVNQFLYLFLSSVLPMIILLISPELGLSFYFTFFVYMFITAVITKRKYYFLQIGVLFFSLILLAYLLPDMFKQITGFLSGGLNWPFVPSLLLMFFFIVVFVVSAGVGVCIGNVKANLFSLSFVLLAFSLIPGALGRCDPGHVFFYGLFIFIIAYSYLRIYLKQKLFKIIGFVFIISLFSIYPYMIKMYIPLYIRSMGKYLEKIDAFPSWVVSIGNFLDIDVNEKLKKRKLRSADALEKEFKNIDNITMPFVTGDYYILLNNLKKYVPLFYLSPGYVGSKYAVDRHLKEIQEKEPDYLLLPDKWNEISYPGDYGIINILFCTYYPLVPKKNGNTLYDPFIDYVFSEYSYVKNITDYMLYKKIHNRGISEDK